MKDIRIGRIGCGGISGNHLPQIEKASGGVIHALCDIHPGRLKAAVLPIRRTGRTALCRLSGSDRTGIGGCCGYLYAKQLARTHGDGCSGRRETLLRGKAAGTELLPTLEDGVRMQKMLDAIMDSAEGNSCVDIQ